MNSLINAIILAIVQGITEWLPISSSGHLVIFEKILDYPVSNTFNVALHFGTLMAIFVYFGKDISDILQDSIRLKFSTPNGRLGLYLALATIPAVIAGLLLNRLSESIFSSLTIVTLGFAITGLLLIITALIPKIEKHEINAKNSLIIGASQIISLLPGISRSGTTLSTSLLLGLKEKEALKFSFLLSIPVVFGANILVIGNQTLPKELIIASILSFIFGLLTLHLLYKYVLTKRRNLIYFGVYALILSAILLIAIIIQNQI